MPCQNIILLYDHYNLCHFDSSLEDIIDSQWNIKVTTFFWHKQINPLDLEENAQEATRKATQFQRKYHTFPYQNQNFISISRKNIVPLCSFSEKNEVRL